MAIVSNEDKELDDFAEEVKKGENPTSPATKTKEEKNKYKTIDIDWDQVPYIFSLKTKMKKALELDIDTIPGEGAFLVKNGAGPHTVTENSCDCKDWAVNGTSINPCKHMMRVKYSVEELTKMIGKTPPDKIINGKAKMVQKAKEAGVQKVEQHEIAVIDREEEDLLMIPDLTPALAEIGKIKIGYLGEKRTKSGKRLPEKLDHFEIGTLLKDDEGGVVMDKEMTGAIGEDKTELDISLCYDEPALNFPTFYAAFTQSKLACLGNGRKAWQRQEDGGRKEIVCDRRQCSLAKDKRCKPYGRLSVILTTANRIGGTYVFRTTSWNSLRNILSSMSFIRNQTGGILAGIPLKLKLRAATAAPNGLGHKVKIYVVNMEYAGTMEQLKQDATTEIKRRKILGLNMNELEQVQKGAIKEHVHEEAEAEAEELSGEFYGEEDPEE
jgi:predicted nucleic acid-binding Zn finger protein